MSSLTSLPRIPSGRTSLAFLMSAAVHGLVSAIGGSGAVSEGTRVPERVLVDLLPPEEPPSPPSALAPQPETEPPPPEPPPPPVSKPEPPAQEPPSASPPEGGESSAAPAEPDEEVANAAPELDSALDAAASPSNGLALPSGLLRGLGRKPGARSGNRGPRAARPAPAQPPLAPVPVADLGARPRPPVLDDLLERNFPASARLQGRAGTARVALLIDRNGRVRSVRGVSSTGPEFAAACKRTLLGSRWTPPRDANGVPVPTIVPYECRFLVGR